MSFSLAFDLSLIHIFLSCDSRLGVGIDYPHPRQIGADRLANAVGAAAYYGYPLSLIHI